MVFAATWPKALVLVGTRAMEQSPVLSKDYLAAAL